MGYYILSDNTDSICKGIEFNQTMRWNVHFTRKLQIQMMFIFIPKVCTNNVEELPRSLTPPLPPTEFARGGILI